MRNQGWKLLRMSAPPREHIYPFLSMRCAAVGIYCDGYIPNEVIQGAVLDLLEAHWIAHSRQPVTLVKFLKVQTNHA